VAEVIAAMASAWTAARGAPAWLWLVTVILLLALVAGVSVYHLGASSTAADVVKGSLDNLHERATINEEIHNSSDGGLCRKLGGLRDECKHL
jgi:hypothetical protein